MIIGLWLWFSSAKSQRCAVQRGSRHCPTPFVAVARRAPRLLGTDRLGELALFTGEFAGDSRRASTFFVPDLKLQLLHCLRTTAAVRPRQRWKPFALVERTLSAPDPWRPWHGSVGNVGKATGSAYGRAGVATPTRIRGLQCPRCQHPIHVLARLTRKWPLVVLLQEKASRGRAKCPFRRLIQQRLFPVHLLLH